MGRQASGPMTFQSFCCEPWLLLEPLVSAFCLMTCLWSSAQGNVLFLHGLLCLGGRHGRCLEGDVLTLTLASLMLSQCHDESDVSF
ncbi:hypothetical protein J1N35_035149 [Gossypium stocksii]|uniref:Uncharacterized protein n=1 Tax=Gossypium stocksii TaxID=47602 RepID=A0A9D3ZQP1_9ROSI|nr:hypothetical protein J1N35_035149 [Gossypium stocksii]